MADTLRPETTDFDWLRAYTMLSVRGLVPPEIQRCEEAWSSHFLGDKTAVKAVKSAEGYEQYVAALRALLRFPLTLYRVATMADYARWAAGAKRGPVGMTANYSIAMAYKDAVSDRQKELVIFKVIVSEPKAIVMRGRIEGYEVVVDPGLLNRSDVAIVYPSET